MSSDEADRTRRKEIAVGIATVVVTLLLVGMAATTGVLAQDNNSSADYYDDWENVSVDNESWMEGNEEATLDNTTSMFLKIQSFVIGASDDSGQSATLLTGVLTMGIVLGIAGSSGVGLLAGGVLTVGSLVAAESVGLAPGWLYPLLLMGIGLLLASIAKRVLQ